MRAAVIAGHHVGTGVIFVMAVWSAKPWRTCGSCEGCDCAGAHRVGVLPRTPRRVSRTAASTPTWPWDWLPCLGRLPGPSVRFGRFLHLGSALSHEFKEPPCSEKALQMLFLQGPFALQRRERPDPGQVHPYSRVAPVVWRISRHGHDSTA